MREQNQNENKTLPSRKAKRSIRSYRELQKQLHSDLLAQHPEWINANGDCPTCDEYEGRLAQLISIFKAQAKKISGQQN
jgi:hypothetical protein